MKEHLLIKCLLSLFILFTPSTESFGCPKNGKELMMENLKEFKTQLLRDLPEGTPVTEVMNCFTLLQIAHTYVLADKTVYAIIPKVDRFRLIYTTNLLIRIHVNEDQKVKSIEYELEHTGL